MVELFNTLGAWADDGHRAALATVIDTWGSSPRPVGSMMAVRDDGLVYGSVSGGCVEGAVIEEAQRVLAGGPPKVLEFQGVEPQEVWRVGLTCGGRIRVLVEAVPEVGWGPKEEGRRPEAGGSRKGRDRVAKDAKADGAGSELAVRSPADESSLWAEAGRKSKAREPYVWVSVVFEDGVRHALTEPSGQCVAKDPEVALATADRAVHAFEDRQSSAQEIDGRTAFFHVRARPDQLLIVGAVHIAIPLIAFASRLGFETVLIDPRPTFIDPTRFLEPPNRSFSDWPQEVLPEIGLDRGTYVVLLSHDPKIDDPALKLLLRSEVRYIGALGSRKTQAERRDRMLAEGFSEAELGRIHGPIGLDIGAKSPEEIALAIMAEIVKVRREGNDA